MFLDATALSNAFYGRGSGPIHLDDVACTGTETNILQCRYDPITSDCGHSEDAGVQCVITSKFMLTSENLQSVGRLESTISKKASSVRL